MNTVSKSKPVTCSGHCCEQFWLPYSPEKIHEMAKDNNIVMNENPKEMELISEMIILLKEPDDGLQYMYTCKHFNKQTRLCMNYDNRPNVCRNHPSGQPCYSDGCTHEFACPSAGHNYGWLDAVRNSMELSPRFYLASSAIEES